MHSNLMTKVACLLAAVSLPFSGFAINSPPTQEASGLLTQLHQDASAVRTSADYLEALGRERDGDEINGWEADAITLENMRDQINQMDQIIYRLRNIESQLPQEQRSEINNITPAMVELTDITQAAIQYLDNHENDLAFSPYTEYAGEMYSEAERVERATQSIENAHYSTHLRQPAATSNLHTGS